MFTFAMIQTCAMGDARFKSNADWYEHELSYILFICRSNEWSWMYINFCLSLWLLHDWRIQWKKQTIRNEYSVQFKKNCFLERKFTLSFSLCDQWSWLQKKRHVCINKQTIFIHQTHHFGSGLVLFTVLIDYRLKMMEVFNYRFSFIQ